MYAGYFTFNGLNFAQNPLNVNIFLGKFFGHFSARLDHLPSSLNPKERCVKLGSDESD